MPRKVIFVTALPFKIWIVRSNSSYAQLGKGMSYRCAQPKVLTIKSVYSARYIAQARSSVHGMARQSKTPHNLSTQRKNWYGSIIHKVGFDFFFNTLKSCFFFTRTRLASAVIRMGIHKMNEAFSAARFLQRLLFLRLNYAQGYPPRSILMIESRTLNILAWSVTSIPFLKTSSSRVLDSRGSALGLSAR